MFNKFKSAIYNVVGNFEPSDGAIGNLRSVSLGSTLESRPSIARQNSLQVKEKHPLRFPYSRPHFLQFSTEDEVLVTADHAIRPIICPRDISRLPWNTGYAETINAGKSRRNEDQAAIHVGVLTRTISQPNFKTKEKKLESKKRKSISESDFGNDESEEIKMNDKYYANDSTEDKKENHAHEKHQIVVSLPYYYFGVFDGHAGWGAAVSAANQLHQIIYEKLCDVIDLIIPKSKIPNTTGPESHDMFWATDKTVTPDDAIIGALEQAFWEMDKLIEEDRLKHQLSGGCTACVALFILGKVFVSNAGDSRATVAHNDVPHPMSFDFTPESETQRIRQLGARNPDWLGEEFTHLEYLRRPMKRDLGKKAIYRDHYMKGWATKIITETDLKYPLVCGEGKRSRVLATIGVTRGFGDHDLKAQFSALPIKPFLTPEPEVRVFDLMDVEITSKDVLILGTDGLWDIATNENAVRIASQSLSQFSSDDQNKYKYRFTSAAHDLVLSARGRLTEQSWRTITDKHATIDDITVFVIPLEAYKIEHQEWLNEAKTASDQLLANCGSVVDIVMSENKNGLHSNVQNNSNSSPKLQSSLEVSETTTISNQSLSLINESKELVNNSFKDEIESSTDIIPMSVDNLESNDIPENSEKNITTIDHFEETKNFSSN